MTPGLHDMPAAAYHADPCPAPSLSNSIIKTLLTKSPKHAWLKHPKLNPAYVSYEESKFDLGSAAHSLLLEGYDCCQVIDAEDWRTKEAKAARERARASGLIPMLHHQYAEAVVMVEVARDYIKRSVLGDILAHGKPEQTLVWTDDESGIWCRGRLDWLTNDHSIIMDYKTTSVGNPGAFCRTQVAAMGYDTQEAFYRRGMSRIGRVTPEFVFLVQEDSAPYACYLVACAPSMQTLAEHKVQRAIDLWAECLATNAWPGYAETIYHAEAAAWAVAAEEEA